VVGAMLLDAVRSRSRLMTSADVLAPEFLMASMAFACHLGFGDLLEIASALRGLAASAVTRRPPRKAPAGLAGPRCPMVALSARQVGLSGNG